MMALAELQRAFKTRVLSRTGALEHELTPTADPDFEERLGAYVEGYRARLLEALAESFPGLKAVLGADSFDARLREYIDATPSTHYSIRYYGATLAAWLEATGTDPGRLHLSELANFEWTLTEVFDAPDDDTLTIDALTNVRPEDWGQVRFVMRASVRRVQSHSNAIECWRAAEGHGAMPERLAGAPTTEWLIWREGLATRYRSLDAEEATAFDAALAGASFAELCEQLAASVEPSEVAVRAATLLRGWIESKVVSRYTLPAGAT